MADLRGGTDPDRQRALHPGLPSRAPDQLAPRFNEIPGMVGHALFAGIAHEIVTGHADASADVIER